MNWKTLKTKHKIIILQTFIGFLMLGFDIGFHIPTLIEQITPDNIGMTGILVITFSIIEGIGLTIIEI